jgi:hypothetical protein
VTVLSFVPLLTSVASAQTAKELVGAWIMVSVTSQQGDKKFDLFGPNTKGIHIYDPSGRFVIIAMRDDLPKIASNNRLTATPEEAQKIMHGSIAYYGSWTANDGVLTVKVEGDVFPNFSGNEFKRQYIISGDQLTVTSPISASGGVNTIVLKRAK